LAVRADIAHRDRDAVDPRQADGRAVEFDPDGGTVR
jgi:hypothetical protein